MKNLLLVGLPKRDLNGPSSAIASLSGVAYDVGYTPYNIDFNVYLRLHLSDEEWNELDKWCLTLDISKHLINKILLLWDDILSNTIKEDCEYICFSVFSFESLLITRLLLEYENNKEKKYKIIVGGAGVSSKFPDTNISFTYWCEKYVDHVVIGDGESEFANILTNGDIQYDMETLDNIPLPSYKVFDYSIYCEDKIYITGSKGCVRKCTFCDVGKYWPTYKYRSAKSLIEEIKKHFYDTGISKFDFTDSLINGSSTNFYNFNVLLAEEKEKNSDLKNITYMGQSICKTKKSMPESHFEAMYYAGCTQLTVGIEHFSEPVRNHMKKKFSDKDIEYYLEQCARWGIPNVILMLVGYPTETEKDHEKNIKDLYKFKHYAKSGVIDLIRFGTTMQMIGDAPINSNHMREKLGIYQDNIDVINALLYERYHWKSKINIENIAYTRIRRRLEIHEACISLKYPQPRVNTELETLKQIALMS